MRLELAAEASMVPRRGGEFSSMSIKGKAYIVGAFEHPTRQRRTRRSRSCTPRWRWRAADAGLTQDDIDGYFCAAGDAPGLGAAVDGRLSRPQAAPRRFDRYRRLLLLCSHVGHAAEAIAPANARSR